MNRPLAGVVLGGIMLTAWLAVDAQQPRATEVMEIKPAKGLYVGVASCAGSSCHGATRPTVATVPQNEYYVWLSEDRHAQTYNVLFSGRSALIVRNMKLPGRPYEEGLCLDCHTTNVPRGLVAGRVDPEDGVQCESCHGPAGGWRDGHTQKGWTHERSVAAGMRELRDVTVRARLCLGCHLGDRDRSVDHELLAAGHPLLPFELDNYTESLPPHWRRGKPGHGLEAWAVGQAIALREALGVVAVQARSDRWPEFSAQQCTQCHHDLAGGAARQQRGYRHQAGLPEWSPRHYAVFRRLVMAFAPEFSGELASEIGTLAEAVTKMNAGPAVAVAAERSRDLVDRLIPRLARIEWQDARAQEMIFALTTPYEGEVDLATGEQIALSLQSLATYRARLGRTAVSSALLKRIDELFDTLEDGNRFDAARFAAVLEAVRAETLVREDGSDRHVQSSSSR